MFEVELPVRSVFEAPTIAGLAAEVEKARALGLKARTPVFKPHQYPSVPGIESEALRLQLEKLSTEEARKLLKALLDGKHSLESPA